MGVKERKAREFKLRENEILATAYDLLTKLEPIQMTMEMIAEKTEIGRGTIYKHFKSKDEIYVHLILKRREEFIEQLRLMLQKSHESKSNKNLLKKLINSYMEYSVNDVKAFTVHKKCTNHYVKSNVNESLLEKVNLQEKENINLVKLIMEKAFNELSVESSNINYFIYAGWGMLRGAMDFMMEGRINDSIVDKKLFQQTIEEIFLRGMGIGEINE